MFVENAINIGREIYNDGKGRSIGELWIKNLGPMEKLLIVDVDDKGEIISSTVKEFDNERTYIDSLYYQQGNDLKKGSGVAIHTPQFVADENHSKHKDVVSKIQKKLNYSLEFNEISLNISPKIIEIIKSELKENSNQTYFVEIRKNGNTTFELFREKFEQEIKKSWKTEEKLSKAVKSGICHSCGFEGHIYDTAIYNCYNNDKESYSNIYNDIGKAVFAYGICDKCIEFLLNGRAYINENLSTSWMGSSVMFVPHDLTKEVRRIYEEVIKTRADENSEYSTHKFLRALNRRESNVFRRISDASVMTDIVFYEVDQSAWKIKYSIPAVTSSRFSSLGNVLGKYESLGRAGSEYQEHIYLRDVVDLLCITGSEKERMRILDILFKGKKYDRNIFFTTAMKQYRKVYNASLEKGGKKFYGDYEVRKVIKVYNMLVELGCLQGRLFIIDEKDGNKMKTFNNKEEFFDYNKEFFDTEEKKAWFTLGMIHNRAVYESKVYHGKEKGDKSHMESSFLFSNRFDKVSFIKIANKAKEQFVKYGKPNVYSQLFTEARLAMVDSNNKLGSDEAKYIFFWGVEAFFEDMKKNTDEKIDENNINMEEN